MHNGIMDHFQLVSSHFGLSSALWLTCIVPAGLGLIIFSYISYLHLNYIYYYLYTCLYNIDMPSSLYLNMAPITHLHYTSLLSCPSPPGDHMSSPMHHMPTGGISCVLPVAFRHWLPFPGLGTMPNSYDQCQFRPMPIPMHAKRRNTERQGEG